MEKLTIHQTLDTTEEDIRERNDHLQELRGHLEAMLRILTKMTDTIESQGTSYPLWSSAKNEQITHMALSCAPPERTTHMALSCTPPQLTSKTFCIAGCTPNEEYPSGIVVHAHVNDEGIITAVTGSPESVVSKLRNKYVGKEYP